MLQKYELGHANEIFKKWFFTKYLFQQSYFRFQITILNRLKLQLELWSIKTGKLFKFCNIWWKTNLSHTTLLPSEAPEQPMPPSLPFV